MLELLLHRLESAGDITCMEDAGRDVAVSAGEAGEGEAWSVDSLFVRLCGRNHEETTRALLSLAGGEVRKRTG
jgi:hypothetical protein